LNYLVKHWRGELSLGMAFGVNVFLFNIALGIVDNYLNLHLPTEHPIILARTFIGTTIFRLLMVYPWQIIGLWRTCNRYIAEGKNSGGAKVLKGIIVFGFLASIGTINQYWLVLKDNFHLGFHFEDEFADYKISLTKDRKLLYLKGGMGFGVSDSIEKKLEATPNIEGIILDSRGGRVYEGRELAKLINRFKLNTYSLKGCYSACAISFIAGKRRFLSSEANLAFHKYQQFGSMDVDMKAEQEKDLLYFRQVGVKEEFLNRLYETSASDLWYPTVDQLLAGNVIHDVVNTSDLTPVNYPVRTKEILGKVLAGSPAYQTIRKHEPEVYRKLIVNFNDAIEKGASLVEVQRVGMNSLSSIVMRSVIKAQDDTIIEFIKLLIIMLKEANNKDPIVCMKLGYPEQYGAISYSDNISSKVSEQYLQLFNRILIESYEKRTISINAKSAENVVANVFPQLDENALAYMELKNLQNKNDYRMHCKVIIDLYSIIVTNKKREAANALRYLFSQS